MGTNGLAKQGCRRREILQRPAEVGASGSDRSYLRQSVGPACVSKNLLDRKSSTDCESAAEPGDSCAPEVNSAPIPLDPSPRIVPMARLEREAIERALELCGGNVPRAAHHLGISGATIYRKRAAWQKEAEGSL